MQPAKLAADFVLLIRHCLLACQFKKKKYAAPTEIRHRTELQSAEMAYKNGSRSHINQKYRRKFIFHVTNKYQRVRMAGDASKACMLMN